MADLARKEQTASTRGWSGLRERWVRPALMLGCDGRFKPADFARPASAPSPR